MHPIINSDPSGETIRNGNNTEAESNSINPAIIFLLYLNICGITIANKLIIIDRVNAIINIAGIDANAHLIINPVIDQNGISMSVTFTFSAAIVSPLF
jgi:hypothetical protein